MNGGFPAFNNASGCGSSIIKDPSFDKFVDVAHLLYPFDLGGGFGFIETF